MREIFSKNGNGHIRNVTVTKLDDVRELENIGKDRGYLEVRDIEKVESINVYAVRVLKYLRESKEQTVRVSYLTDLLVIDYTVDNRTIPDEDTDITIIKDVIMCCIKNINHICTQCGNKMIVLSTGDVCMHCK